MVAAAPADGDLSVSAIVTTAAGVRVISRDADPSDVAAVKAQLGVVFGAAGDGGERDAGGAWTAPGANRVVQSPGEPGAEEGGDGVAAGPGLEKIDKDEIGLLSDIAGFDRVLNR